jgi:hypothetical protein
VLAWDRQRGSQQRAHIPADRRAVAAKLPGYLALRSISGDLVALQHLQHLLAAQHSPTPAEVCREEQSAVRDMDDSATRPQRPSARAVSFAIVFPPVPG